MPIHDWSCACGAEVLDHYQPRTGTEPPPCPNEELDPPDGVARGHQMERLWSLSSSGAYKMEEFDMHVPGQGTVHFSSMEQLRKVEKHCETNGPRPFIIRQYSQDISNRNDNVFGDRPNPKFATRSSRTGIPFRQQIAVKE